MKKNLFLILILFIANQLFAQVDSLLPFNSLVPEAYIETNLTSKQLKDISRDFSVDMVNAEGDDCYKVRLCISRKEYGRFLSLGIPFSFVPSSKLTVRMAHSYEQFTSNWDRSELLDS